jgi:magnesium transporter
MPRLDALANATGSVMKSGVQLDRPVTEFLSQAAVTLRENLTIDQALASLRGTRSGQVLYLYVVNDAEQLVGVLPSRKLIMSPGQTRVGELMTRNIVSLSQRDTLFDALELFAMYRLLALPVVDADKKLLGIVEVSLYTDEIFELVQNQQLKEVFQLIGLRLEQHKQGSPWRGFRLRMPWLASNITGGLICAVLGSFFEATVRETVVIALFIPVILTLAESVAVQSMTLAIEQAMSTPGRRSYAAQFAREAATALLLGISSGAVVGTVSLLWRQKTAASWTIAGSVATTMLLAAMLGRAVPKIIHVMKLNPRVASGPITLAVVDVMTVTIYLSASTMVLNA